MEKIWQTVVEGTRRFVEDAGFEKVVVGMSGGIDSSVVTCVATAAVGARNVLGVLMPSPYSSAGSITDSQELAAAWGVETLTLHIEPLMSAFDAALAEPFAGTDRDTTEENLQARIRSVLLMALSNKRGRLVLNTCNKSEDYVGYCTLYGDSCGAVAPLGDLYKTEVYALARWINAEPDLPDIPEAILSKAPSAELAEDQKDTDSLPPYEELDPLLRLIVDDEKTREEIVAAGHEPRLVERVIRLYESSAYKREQSPPPVPVAR